MTEAEAILRAKEIALEHGWTWIEPAMASLRDAGQPNAHWEVFSNCQGLGAKVLIHLDERTGQVVSKGYIPR